MAGIPAYRGAESGFKKGLGSKLLKRGYKGDYTGDILG